MERPAAGRTAAIHATCRYDDGNAANYEYRFKFLAGLREAVEILLSVREELESGDL